LAVILHGYPRLTVDADILVKNSPANLQKLLEYLKTWGEGWARELTIEDFNVDQGSIRISEEFNLDVFVSMRGKSLDDFRPNLRYFDSDDARIAYLACRPDFSQRRFLAREGSIGCLRHERNPRA